MNDFHDRFGRIAREVLPLIWTQGGIDGITLLMARLLGIQKRSNG